jgi:hypothetical protein
MTAIETGPNMIRRTIPGWLNHYTDEWVPARKIEERDRTLPFTARRGSVAACARTAEAAVSMVERIEAAAAVPPGETE